MVKCALSPPLSLDTTRVKHNELAIANGGVIGISSASTSSSTTTSRASSQPATSSSSYYIIP